MTFFLLDAVLAFYAEEELLERRVATVRIAGGWFNGSWQEEGRFESTKIGSRGDELISDVHPFAPFPLDAQPASWHFECGLQGGREGRVRIKTTSTNSTEELPVADLSEPLSSQLAEVPRCVSTSGDILFFHRVVPFLGPEYAPGMEYGLCTDSYAFFVSDFHASLRGLPIVLDPSATSETALIWIKGMHVGNMPPEQAILHPMLRERLLFSGVDAYTAMRHIPYDEMPLMADVEHGQEMRFRPRCNHISLAPLSTGLGFVGVAGYPPAPAPQARTLWRRLFD